MDTQSLVHTGIPKNTKLETVIYTQRTCRVKKENMYLYSCKIKIKNKNKIDPNMTFCEKEHAKMLLSSFSVGHVLGM